MKADDFDRRFDDGEDVADLVDWSRAERPNLTTKRVNVDFPLWMVAALDREARRLNTTRQAIIKRMIDDQLDAPGR